MNKRRLIDLFIVLVLISCIVFVGVYYYTNAVNECLSNPLSYSAKKVENLYPNNEVFGQIWILPNGVGNPLIISFNSTNFSYNN